MRKLRDIQVCRALAASAVVFAHAESRVSRSLPDGGGSSFGEHLVLMGHSGVDLFFIISGLIMVYAHGEDLAQPRAAWSFCVKRIKRIVPAYWIVTTIALGVVILAPQLSYYSRGLDWPWIAASYLFIPWRSDSGLEVPLVGVGWTLNYEMYFYVVFAVFMMLPRRLFLPAISLYFVACVLIGLLLRKDTPIAQMLTSSLLLEFLLGCYLGAALRGRVVLSRRTAAIAFAIGAGLFAGSTLIIHRFEYSHLARLFLWGLPLTLIVASSVLRPSSVLARAPNWVVAIGDSSYSLYLTHVLSLPAAAIALRMTGVGIPADLAVLLIFLCALGVGWLFFQVVERPISDALRPRSKQGPTLVPAAPSAAQSSALFSSKNAP